MREVKVEILHEGKKLTLPLRFGLGLQSLCARHQTPIEFDCRKADCGICLVQVQKGLENLNRPGEAEADFLKAMQAKTGERLACQTRVFGDVTLFVDTAY